MSQNNPLRVIALTAGYLIWFAILVRVLFLSTGNPYTGAGDLLGSHVGLAFWLIVLGLIPYFIARSRAKKSGEMLSWSFVMTGVTIIALTLSVGGFYGRLQSLGNQPPQVRDTAADSQEVSGFIVGEWQCMDTFSKEISRLVLHADGSTSGSVGSGPTFRDPWLHWYFPIQEHSKERVFFLRIRVQGPNQLIVQNPNDSVKSCTREGAA